MTSTVIFDGGVDLDGSQLLFTLRQERMELGKGWS